MINEFLKTYNKEMEAKNKEIDSLQRQLGIKNHITIEEEV